MRHNYVEHWRKPGEWRGHELPVVHYREVRSEDKGQRLHDEMRVFRYNSNDNQK